MSRQLSGGSPPVHICFYSNKCDWCKAFITELKQTAYFNEFRFVCVDPAPNRPSLPSWLKKVPTLVISGEPEPRTDSDVMNWLYERKMKDSSGRSSSSSDGGAGGGGGGSEPQPLFSDMNNSAFGDSYSMLNMDTSAQGAGGSQELNNFYGFSFLQGGDAVGTREGQSFQTTNMTGKRSKKEEMLDAQMENYMKQRDMGIPKKVARM
jgi:hypothetical protein